VVWDELDRGSDAVLMQVAHERIAPIMKHANDIREREGVVQVTAEQPDLRHLRQRSIVLLNNPTLTCLESSSAFQLRHADASIEVWQVVAIAARQYLVVPAAFGADAAPRVHVDSDVAA
jgi:hypothetical protein